jgi:hypothetical protein
MTLILGISVETSVGILRAVKSFCDNINHSSYCIISRSDIYWESSVSLESHFQPARIEHVVSLLKLNQLN